MSARFVVGFAFDAREQIVALMLKARPEWQRGALNGIGGHVEDGETPDAAMRREWEEEAPGVAIVGEWQLFAELKCGESASVWFYRANSTELGSAESGSDGEEIVLADPDGLPPNVLQNLRWLVPMARASCRVDWPFVIHERAARPEGDTHP